MKAGEMLECGSMDGRALWLQIIEAIGELRVLKRSSTEGILRWSQKIGQ
jgi:hypothetical protein